MPPRATTAPLIPFDAGWLFIAAGLTILAATVLIPAADDLDEARWQRDRALAIQEHRNERLERYGRYLGAVDRGDESVVLSLAAAQLNKVPAGWESIDPASPVTGRVGPTSASVFPQLEPDPLVVPPRLPVGGVSLLARLTTGEETRLWMIVGGAVCVLVGVMPAATRHPAPRPRAPSNRTATTTAPAADADAHAEAEPVAAAC